MTLKITAMLLEAFLISHFGKYSTY